MEQQNAAPAEEAPKIPNDQLDSLVAPIALYPDPLLSQTLVASTYPVEVIQLQQWMKKNTGLKDQALAEAVAKQPWDASVQGLAAFPDVVERLAENIQWSSDLGNAFLAQQADVMAAVQRMRAKAQGTGALKTSAQQTIQTQAVDGASKRS
jgi:hydroxypyruvate isomerase